MFSFLGFKRKPKKKVTRKRVLLPEQQRAAVRLEVTVPGLWRDAPGGKAVGAYTRGSITDISRTGASLTVDREIKRGTQLEIKLSVSTSARPLVLLGEVMRSNPVEASGKSALGLRFLGITPEEDRTIMEFINKRQAERRSRGLA
jgi:c-di-GMP-binding flagellar brake protein YcgR